MLGTISNLVTPFVVALVCAALFHPLVDRLESFRIPRLAGSLIVVILLLTVLSAMLWVTTVGIVSQSDEMAAQSPQGH